MIKSVILNSGMRLIGEVTESADGRITIEKPLVYSFADNGQGMAVNFGAFAPEAEDSTITLLEDGILAIFVPDNSITNHYKTVFGGIVTPPEAKLQLLN